MGPLAPRPGHGCSAPSRRRDGLRPGRRGRVADRAPPGRRRRVRRATLADRRRRGRCGPERHPASRRGRLGRPCLRPDVGVASIGWDPWSTGSDPAHAVGPERPDDARSLAFRAAPLDGAARAPGPRGGDPRARRRRRRRLCVRGEACRRRARAGARRSSPLGWLDLALRDGPAGERAVEAGRALSGDRATPGDGLPARRRAIGSGSPSPSPTSRGSGRRRAPPS